MQVIKGRNVNAIYPAAMELVRREGQVLNSRNGSVLAVPCPVCAVYERPDEMVLLDPARGANPFFHCAEALWMLAGRSDAAYLNHYVRDFGERFANAEGHLDGAYGERWRYFFKTRAVKGADLDAEVWPIDQIQLTIDKLRANPDDRRVVIQMWDVLKDNNPDTKDSCCNQQLFPRIVNGCLDLTVTCRSNDSVWGATGANAVHFPFLQLYLAGRIGVPVGKFYQVSMNYHTYEAVLPKVGTPRPALLDPYLRGEVTSAAIGSNWDCWDSDLYKFMAWHDKLWDATENADLPDTPDYVNSWFKTCPAVLSLAYWKYRRGSYDTAREIASMCSAPDWRAGALLWLDQAAFKRQGGASRQPVPDGPQGGVAPDNEVVGDVRPARQ